MLQAARRNKLFGLIDHVSIVITAALFVLTALPAQAMTNNWKASTTGDWSDAANWVEGFVPTNGDDAVITNSGVSVLLSSASSNLSSLTLSRTLTFSNWDTYLSATNVSILSNGLMTCVGPFSNSVMSNRVYVICSNITIAAGGSISVNSKGYSGAGSSGGGGAGQGPGGALGSRSSGSYGGVGGNFGGQNGPVYGSAAAPEYAGSGGGYNTVNSLRGGHGGGAVRIDASGTVTLNGLITANGEDNTSNNSGTGSGGGVWINCLVLTGAETIANTCSIRANGGSIATGGAGGSGGGGRIAILYDPTAQSALPVVPPLNLSVKGGTTSYQGELGTIYLPDGQWLTESMSRMNGEILNVASWSPTNLVVSNCTIRLPAAGFRLTVSNDLQIVNSGALMLGGDALLMNASLGGGVSGPYLRYTSTTAGPSLSVAGNLVVTNGSLHIYSGVTNNATPAYGASASIQGDVRLYSSSWIYPVSHPTNGGSVLFTLSNLYVYAGGGINAAARGFAGGDGATAYGPGKGGSRSGGGYGGGGGYSFGGQIYGDSNAPTLPGSGGGKGISSGLGNVGGNGGGLIRINAVGSIMIDGSLSANGNDGGASHAGGGSGGGIYLTCRSLGGTNISLSAAGGTCPGVGGGGGGGRIAVWRMYSSGAITTTNVSGGEAGSYDGTNGTVVLGWIPLPGTIMTFK